jgi:hypothetical protein
MKRTKLTRTDFREARNLAREIPGVFSITIRPSILNTRCKKEDFYAVFFHMDSSSCSVDCKIFRMISFF